MSEEMSHEEFWNKVSHIRWQTIFAPQRSYGQKVLDVEEKTFRSHLIKTGLAAIVLFGVTYATLNYVDDKTHEIPINTPYYRP